MEKRLKKYEQYMLTKDNMLKIPQLNTSVIKTVENGIFNTKNINSAKVTAKVNAKVNAKTIAKVTAKAEIPGVNLSNQTDKLFWCFYIILNGEHEYELDHSFKKEKDFKIECIEKLRKIKSQVKALKLRLNEIEDELLNCKKITVKSLVAFCLLYKINLIYVWDRKYFEIVNDANSQKNNIIISEGLNIKNLPDVSTDKLNYYRENYWCIENIAKPLKALTSYSKEELYLIISKLEIKDITLKNTKKDMYEKILEKL